MVTNTSGSRKNTANTSIIGAACSHATKDLRSSFMGSPISQTQAKLPGRVARQFEPSHRQQIASGRDELVPFADHVVVFVHDRVPAGHRAHAFLVGAAIAL